MSKQAPTSDAVQALLELRDKLEKHGRFLTMVRQSQQRAATQLRRAELTLEELRPLPESAAVFRPLGRAYVAAARPDLAAELERACAEARDEAAKLGVQAERAEAQLRATEGELRELVRSAPEAAAALMRLGAGGAAGVAAG